MAGVAAGEVATTVVTMVPTTLLFTEDITVVDSTADTTVVDTMEVGTDHIIDQHAIITQGTMAVQELTELLIHPDVWCSLARE